METTFKVGDVVQARVSAQRMECDQFYTVEEVHETSTPFGTFVTYVLSDDCGTRRAVNNLHLLATRVPAGALEA